ncbi:MAG: anti-sigma factor antagonist [Bacteroidales bacterium]|nr:anti-sigma factor antagonist [Bacteroidales bacterium]
MKREIKISDERPTGREVIVSFRNHGTLGLLKHGFIQFTLKEVIQEKGSRLIMDITGVKLIDSDSIDILNLLSRLGRKYDSVIWLRGVEPEVLELLALAKKYAVFDIQHVEPVNEEVA